jgi:hypothetical protein
MLVAAQVLLCARANKSSALRHVNCKWVALNQHSMESEQGSPLFADSLTTNREREPAMGLVLLLLLLLLLFGTVPAYPYSRNWGYQPMGFAGVLLAIILVLILLDVVPIGFNLHHPWHRPIAP